MKKILSEIAKQPAVMHGLSRLALTSATAAANSKCAYIFHDPKKPEELKQLRKF